MSHLPTAVSLVLIMLALPAHACTSDSSDAPPAGGRVSGKVAGGRPSTPDVVRTARQRQRVGSFERGRFREFDGSAVSGGRIVRTTAQAYDGKHAARIESNGVTGNEFERVWYDVNWKRGADVWYGMALNVPQLENWCWWRPIRWDNYKTYRDQGDVGGLRIERGNLYLDAGRYGRATRTLIGPVHIPEGRWFWVEVHQRLSDRSDALSELFLDGRRVGASSQPNSGGRAIRQIRFGNVTLASDCSAASSVLVDRVSVGPHPIGPGG